MKSEILSFYEDLKSIESLVDFPPNWTLVNPYKKHWDIFEFFIDKYYQKNKSYDLIVGLNPGRYGCNKTGIALTDENVLVKKLGYSNLDHYPEVEGTATEIYSLIGELYDDFDDFFSKFFLTNIFPFGVVGDGVNVKFSQIIRIPSVKEFSYEFISKSNEIFNPKKILCIGRGSEKFIRRNFNNFDIKYLHHPAYTFPEEKKDEYRVHLS